jgi:hypothetical protein
VAILASGISSQATGTDPDLALTHVVCSSGENVRVVRLEGHFPADDLVQLAYPLQVLIREIGPGTRYVRYDLSATAVRGDAPELADGLDPSEVADLLAQGNPAPKAVVAFMGVGRLDLVLPGSLPAGPAEAQLFVLENADPVLSNPLPFDACGSGS